MALSKSPLLLLLLALLLLPCTLAAAEDATGTCSADGASAGCQAASVEAGSTKPAESKPISGGVEPGEPRSGSGGSGDAAEPDKPVGEEASAVPVPGGAVRRAKTCIYTIALNERVHVEPFMAAAKGADLVLIADTGSNDGTPEALEASGAVVHRVTLRPFRFDTARNIALSLLPADCDLCLAFDLDEYVQPGWVGALQEAWQKSGGRADAVRYDYIWSWLPDGVTPDGRFMAQKIHGRFHFEWRDPAHELPYWTGKAGEDVVVEAPGLVLHHRAIHKPTRSNYLPLLKLGAAEAPADARRSHYYGRELMFQGQWDAAIQELERHLTLPTSHSFKEERAASLRYIAKCYQELGQLGEAQRAALRGVVEFDLTREPWMALARIAHAQEDWPTVAWATAKALAIASVHPYSRWLTDAKSWGAEPHDLAALAAYYAGDYQRAWQQGLAAAQLEPNNERLRNNLNFYKKGSAASAA
ncbi:hypothetical protein ABPG75_013065 [Micractinium tetrahymenae]